MKCREVAALLITRGKCNWYDNLDDIFNTGTIISQAPFVAHTPTCRKSVTKSINIG